MQGSYLGYMEYFLSIQSTIVLVRGLKECEVGLTRWSWIDVSYYPRKIQEKRKTLQALVQKNGDGSKGLEIDGLCKKKLLA